MKGLKSLWLIARHTWTEVVLSRVFTIFGLLAAGLIGASLFLTDFHFGSAEIRFINDLGQGAISLFGSILVVTLGAQLFFREIEQRTVLPILARPVTRSQFLVGKFLGTLAPILVFVFGMLLLLSALLWWRSQTLTDDPSINRATLEGVLGEAWVAGLFQVFKFFVLASMVFAVASFAQSFSYTVSMGFALFFASHLVHLAVDFYQEGETLFSRSLAFFFAYALPDFRIFNEPSLDPAYWKVLGYAAIYSVAYLGIAVGFFQKREL
ncbi:MAG: ABC transporter permease subunit [Verrucomicrobiota bacterium]